MAVLIVTVFSYIKFSADGILSRSTETLSGTEWIAWSGDSLDFKEDSVFYQTAKESKYYPYQEKVGVVELMDGEEVYKVFLRFNSERLISSDGQTIFYLKSILPYESSEEVINNEED